ncbi:MAG TPA: four helix bundle protein [Gemmatimonadales bacterium]|nr:four helix bundle protein [Gemmatimonadales bacterium]
MGDFKDLKVWQRARRFAGLIYQMTDGFPPKEQYGLTAQSRRAAVSIMSNLAEGSGRGSDRELLRFVRIALGSSRELESHLILAQDLRFAAPEGLSSMRREVQEIRRMLAGLAKRLEDDG